MNSFDIIPLPTKICSDTLVWTKIAFGLYSTTADYVELCMEYHSEISNLVLLIFSWKDFWRTKISYRILLFAWKMWHNVIPTLVNLKTHHLNYDVIALSVELKTILWTISSFIAILSEQFGSVSTLPSHLIAPNLFLFSIGYDSGFISFYKFKGLECLMKLEDYKSFIAESNNYSI